MPRFKEFPSDVKHELRCINNVSKRDIVLLAMTTKCMGCKRERSGFVSGPLMLVRVKDRLVVLFADLHHLLQRL